MSLESEGNKKVMRFYYNADMNMCAEETWSQIVCLWMGYLSQEKKHLKN